MTLTRICNPFVVISQLHTSSGPSPPTDVDGPHTWAQNDLRCRSAPKPRQTNKQRTTNKPSTACTASCSRCCLRRGAHGSRTSVAGGSAVPWARAAAPLTADASVPTLAERRWRVGLPVTSAAVGGGGSEKLPDISNGLVMSGRSAR